MRTFTIDPDNNITALVDVTAGGANNETFSSEKELAKLTADWPMSRLIDAWNGFAEVAPFNDLKLVKKFTNRKAAVSRIWAAVARLSDDVAKPAADVASAKGKRRDTVRPGAKRVANVGRDGSKKADVIDLMRRPSGASA